MNRPAVDFGAVPSEQTSGIGHSEGWESGPPDDMPPPMGDDMPAERAMVLLNAPAIAAPLPELDYLVREIGLVAGAGAPHLVAGYGFSGKTLALQALAVSLASGRAVWGVYPVAARRVAHVDLEQGERLDRRRYQRIAAAMGVNLADLGDALVLAPLPELALRPEHVDRWRGLMHGRDLIIIDSLRAATAGADENDSSIRAGLDMLGGISEQTQCRALVIHHARKQGKDDPGGRYAIRGSGAIFDGVDSAYLFTAEKGEPIRAEHIKARSHGETVEDFALVISDVDAGVPRGGLDVRVHGAELVTQRREQREESARRIRVTRDAETVRRTVARTPGVGTRELRAATSLSGDRLAAALTHLGEAVEIRDEVVGRARTARHFLKGMP